jgi:hypothetical protein
VPPSAAAARIACGALSSLRVYSARRGRTDQDAELLKDGDSLADIVERDVLRHAHDTHGMHAVELREREQDVTRARQHADDKHVMLAPGRCAARQRARAAVDSGVPRCTTEASACALVDVEDLLLHGFVDHEPALDDGHVLPAVVIVGGIVVRRWIRGVREKRTKGHAWHAVAREQD